MLAVRVVPCHISAVNNTLNHTNPFTRHSFWLCLVAMQSKQ